jgi:ferredoxin
VPRKSNGGAIATGRRQTRDGPALSGRWSCGIFNKAPVGVYYGSPGVEAEDPYFGGAGPRRSGCIGCGNCMIGCGNNAKNKLNTNYLYLAESLGARVHELHEVHQLTPLEGGGFEVHARHPGASRGRPDQPALRGP